MRRVIGALTALLLAGCSVAGMEQPTPGVRTGISQQAAIDRALGIALIPQPEINAAQTQTQNAQAELTTLGPAMERLIGSDSLPSGFQPDRLVWLVTMEGTWTDGFPRPADLPTPEPYHHYTVILDANTGAVISVSARP